MKKIEAVLFDMDGVIVDSNPIHKEVLIEFCRKYSEELTEEKEEMFREVFIPQNHIVPGLFEFLDLLDQNGIKKVVATSAPAENADFILAELGITDRFGAVLNASHVNKSKPHPEPYLKAAKAVGVKPENCIVFEDSLSGVKSGAAAGAKVVGVATTHTQEELHLCDLVVDDFRGLKIEKLEELFLVSQN